MRKKKISKKIESENPVGSLPRTYPVPQQEEQRIGESSMPSFSTTPGSNMEDFDAIVPVFSPAINSGTEFLQSLPAPEPIPAKTVILEQGQRPSFVRLIRSGIVKITFTNEDGEESLLGLRSEGWWAGAPLALLDMPSLCNVVTVTPCSVTSISVDQFSERLMQNQRVLRHFISSQCRELMVEQKHGIVQGCSASERLEYLKSENSHSLWRTVDPSSVMCQGEIAKLLAITPEHLSRLLHRRTATKPPVALRPGRMQRLPV